MPKKLLIQIYATDKRDYINEYKDFYFVDSLVGENAEIVYTEINRYIDNLLGNKDNDKIVLKKFER